MTRPGTRYTLEINPQIPERLARLEELAANLWYTWDRATRALFARLNPGLWDAVGHSPKAVLKFVDQKLLSDAAADPAFLEGFERVLTAFDAYRRRPPFKRDDERLTREAPVAYFCAEFGFHESLPIYSGGLGILSGDHCKAASDRQLPFVALGLLYRQGYFIQKIDAEGNQRAEYFDSDFDDLPITPVLTAQGAELRIPVRLPERDVSVRVWRVRAGLVDLYLLDTDVPENSEHDRNIAHRLYGGDRTTRIEQEMVLGTGGVRALSAMGIKPAVWHLNEGHAAFATLERVAAHVRDGLPLEAALEAVASNTVFTTHTAVAAGHDHFSQAMAASYLKPYCADFGIDAERVLALGRLPGTSDFNMTTLAVHGSRYQNGVSEIHGRVSARLLREHWPQVPEEENPVSYVTNGVHIPTFLAPEWGALFDRYLGEGWMLRLEEPATREQIRAIPDAVFWSTRQTLKVQMLHMLRHRVRLQHTRNNGVTTQLERLLRHVDPDNPDVLTIGFARRFATYKRAQLLFDDLDVLRQLFGDAGRPLVFVFAGKAHPADEPGQELIRSIARVARLPEFEGKILLIEGYELHLARRLVSGVDVWLNNPIFPLEASGTSGMKAGMNGVINLSVLDGWWAEGYDGGNGWAIEPAPASLPPERRDSEEAGALYSILREQLIPLYYRRDASGCSPGWIARSKQSMASILPRYNATRMLNEYVARFYEPASELGRRHAHDNWAGSRRLAAWKSRVRSAWPGVSARRVDSSPKRAPYGEGLRVEVLVQLNGLSAQDIEVELLLERSVGETHERCTLLFQPTGAPGESGEQRYCLELRPELCGRLEYRIRLYPQHELLAHRFELGLMTWL